ncbi:Phosphorylase pyridoxal-phosphate attachment site [Sesbania bispinosa]|nr:Phosphorylase pyridoxal-phosphate attachment site [Sesbania bispinosa]
MLIPGSELSQHISTAGTEASGKSNMKIAMNGCILIGTLDGATVETRQEVGEDNFFRFGARAHEITGLRKERAKGKWRSGMVPVAIIIIVQGPLIMNYIYRFGLSLGKQA